MQQPRVLKRHAALTDRMATKRGVDLEEEVMRGNIGVVDISDAVLRCTACSNPDHCWGWLDQQEGVVKSTPGYCRNADLFDKLSTDTD
ncbi:MAG: DUF6455 family protein [Paracoccaceae bacterium]